MVVDDRVILAVKGARFINVFKNKPSHLLSFVSSVNFSINFKTNLASFVKLLISSLHCCTANSVCDWPEQNRSNFEIPTIRLNHVTFVSTGHWSISFKCNCMFLWEFVLRFFYPYLYPYPYPFFDPYHLHASVPWVARGFDCRWWSGLNLAPFVIN